MVVVDVVVQTHLGIEEIVVMIDDVYLVGIHAIGHRGVLQLVVDMSVLQIQECIQPPDELVRGLTVDVDVVLDGVVAVVFEVGCQRCRIGNGGGNAGLHPYDMSELVADIAVPAATHDDFQVLLVVIVHRRHDTVEVVVHLLLVHEVFHHALVSTQTVARP